MLRPDLARLLCAALIGSAVGWAAWGAGRTPVLAALIPLAWAACSRSRDAAAMLAAYTLVATRFFASGASNFGSSAAEVVTILAGWAANGLLMGLLWGVAHCAQRLGRAALALAGVGLQVVLLAPPMWLLSIAHPVSAWGFLLPGTGTVGLVTGIVLPVLLGAMYGRQPGRRLAGALAAAAGAGVLASIATVGLAPVSGVQAVTTAWGPSEPTPNFHPIDRLPLLAQTVSEFGKPATFAWPETALGMASDATEGLIRRELVPVLRRQVATAIVGMDRLVDGRPRVSALVVEPDGRMRWLDARQPTPVSLWRPWDAERSYSADWSRTNLVQLHDGRRAWVSFCHEDVQPGMLLAAIWTYRPDMVLSLVNNWWMPDVQGVAAQAHAVEGIARLYGLDLARAVNLPRPSHGSPAGPGAAP